MSDYHQQIHEVARNNRAVRQRNLCILCDKYVETSPEFIQAGGVLEGPFCSMDCVWEWLGGEQ